MEVKTKREAIIELVNKLFIYTDSQQWDKLLKDVFKEKVKFDMSSMGTDAPKEISAKAICEMWKESFTGIDHIHHQAGNYIIDFTDDGIAEIFCYAVATHYKKTAKQGTLREFTGSYKLHASFTDQGWRLDSFKYTLKFISGNADLT
jgi:hypothetical protein